MQTNHLLLKGSGRITAVHGVAHSTYQGVASWYFLGDVAWSAEENNGREAKLLNHEIPPYAICYDSANEAAGKAEVDAIMKGMNEHLASKGKWHKPKEMKDGRMVSWTPKEKTGLSPL